MKHKIESITIGIGVGTGKAAEAALWYQSLLGETEIMEPAPGTVELKLTGDTWLQLDDTGYLAAGGGSAVIRLGTGDIEAAHRRAESLADHVEDIVTVEGMVKFFDFKDPSGNRLSYVQLL